MSQTGSKLVPIYLLQSTSAEEACFRGVVSERSRAQIQGRLFR